MITDAQDGPVIDAKLLNAHGTAGGLTPQSVPKSMLRALRGIATPLQPSEAVDWKQWLNSLEAHRLLPLLYRHVTHHGIAPSLPADVVARLKSTYMANWAGNARLERELASIAVAFYRDGLPFLVLKGPGFARTIYPDPAMRPFDDIDLLVASEDFKRARILLKALGYQATTGLGLEHHQEFAREEKGYRYPVELHRTLNIFPRIGWGLPVKEVFERAIDVEIADYTFRTLHPVDAFLHSALHVFTHHREEIRLIWICDLARIPELFCEGDWRELQDASVRWMARLAVEEGLEMAHNWFGTVVPAPFSDFARWPAPRKEELDLWESLRGHGQITGLMKLYGSEYFGFFEKMLQVFYVVFPPVHVMAKRYPVRSKFLLPLAYARRWWTLLQKRLS
jgi:hypothetical protein